MNASVKAVVTPLMIIVAATALAVASLQTLRNQEGAYVEFPTAPTVAWNPELFHVVSFGHLPAFIDWFWLKALQDPAIYHVQKGVRAPVFHTYNLLTSLDPLFRAGYEVGAKMLTVIRDDNEGALHLLLKADQFRKTELPRLPAVFRERYWSDEWQFPLLLAYVYLFELDNLPLAGERFIEASKMSGSPPYLQSLAARLGKPGGQFEVGIRLINFMIEGKKDNEPIRDQLVRKRDSIYVLEYLTRTNERFLEFLKSKSDYRRSVSIEPKRIQSYWDEFVRSERVSLQDPLGGKIYLSSDGRVVSTTPTVPVFGLGGTQ